jgi:hypothetical protein
MTHTSKQANKQANNKQTNKQTNKQHTGFEQYLHFYYIFVTLLSHTQGGGQQTLQYCDTADGRSQPGHTIVTPLHHHCTTIVPPL